MNTTKPRRVALAVSLITLGIAGTLVVERVRAAGIPDGGALTYSGTLALADGSSVTGAKNIGLVAFSAATGGSPVCQVLSTQIPVSAGRFQIALPAECTAAVKANPDLWIDVQVDGASIGRTKLGAVPYAIEAGHADNATTAASATSAAMAVSATNATKANSAGSADALRTVPVSSTAPVAGQVLTYQGAQWSPLDLRWAIMHGAASAACAAASPVGDSGASHAVLPRPAGTTCTAHCATSNHPKCRTAIAIGSLLLTQAVNYSDAVGLNYNYGCEDNQNGYDEVKGQGLADASYVQYCCCYR